MDIAANVFGALGGILAVAATVIAVRHHYFALWIGTCAAIAFVVCGACWLHDYWRTMDAAATPAAPATIGSPKRDDQSGGHESRNPSDALVAQKHITPQYVRNTINDAPPISQHLVAKQFIGVPISWDGRLFGGFTYSDHVRVVMKSENVIFAADVDISKYPFLAQVKEGTLLHIDGVIETIEIICIQIKDAIISLIGE